jgi:hypothetical protein
LQGQAEEEAAVAAEGARISAVEGAVVVVSVVEAAVAAAHVSAAAREAI